MEARLAAVPADGPPVRLGVVITDADGASQTLRTETAITPYPDGSLLPSRRWGQRVFAPLGTTSEVDLAHITSISLVPSTAPGRAWIIDVSAPPTVG